MGGEEMSDALDQLLHGELKTIDEVLTAFIAPGSKRRSRLKCIRMIVSLINFFPTIISAWRPTSP